MLYSARKIYLFHWNRFNINFTISNEDSLHIYDEIRRLVCMNFDGFVRSLEILYKDVIEIIYKNSKMQVLNIFPNIFTSWKREWREILSKVQPCKGNPVKENSRNFLNKRKLGILEIFLDQKPQPSRSPETI